MRATFHYTGIRVRDLAASIEFYTGLLGMAASEPIRFPETGGVVVDLTSDGSTHPLELNYYEPGSRYDSPFEPGQALDHLCFQVPNLDSAIEEARRAGHPVVEEVRTPRSRWVYIRDPDGIWIELSASAPP